MTHTSHSSTTIDQTLELTVTSSGSRLDQYITRHVPELSRSRVLAMIKMGKASVNGRAAKPGQRVTQGDTVLVRIPAPSPIGLVPEEIPLTIVYEDADLLIVDKP